MPAPDITTGADIVRFSMSVRKGQQRALDLAKLEDHVPRTSRIRAMIDLWILDEGFRAQVDKIARGWLKESA
jgi:hypothetical protein